MISAEWLTIMYYPWIVDHSRWCPFRLGSGLTDQSAIQQWPQGAPCGAGHRGGWLSGGWWFMVGKWWKMMVSASCMVNHGDFHGKCCFKMLCFEQMIWHSTAWGMSTIDCRSLQVARMPHSGLSLSTLWISTDHPIMAVCDYIAPWGLGIYEHRTTKS